MGQILSKLRPRNRHSVSDPDTGTIPTPQSIQAVSPVNPKSLQLQILSQGDGSMPSENHRPEALAVKDTPHSPAMDDRFPNTAVGASSTANDSPQILSKQLSWGSSHPRPQYVQVSSIIDPETNSKVFRWEINGDKPALRILCSDLCEGLAQLAAETPRVWTEFPGHVVVEPYELIFHNKTRIKENKAPQIGTGNCQRHLRFLLEYLEEKEKPRAWGRIEAIEARRCKTITFDTVSLLYRRGDTVLQNIDGTWRAYAIERHEHKTSTNIEEMLIHVRYLDFDKTGNSLVPHATVFKLPKFDSERLVSSLELIPQRFLDHMPDLMAGIKERGAEYYRYGGDVHYRLYDGSEWPRPSQKAPLRVILDYVTSSSRTQSLGITNIADSSAFCSICAAKAIGLPSYPEDIEHDPFMCSPDERNGAEHQSGLDTDQDKDSFLFCPPHLWAFSLHYKTWRPVSPDDLSEVEKRDEPFEDELYMGSVQKKQFKSIATTYMDILKQRNSSEASSKSGQGFNVLLCGNPGVGKTFTAECLSEKYGFPLYTMTCGDLGDEPESFELRLHETFLRGINWKTIVLLDGIDDYIYSRSRQAPKRSYLAPILLRHLETSESLNIITVTSAQQADKAFLDRVQLSLHLRDFTFIYQQKLWRKAFQSTSLESRDKDELEQFIQTDLETVHEGAFNKMNARQINNAVRLAIAIARGDRSTSSTSDFGLEHIEATLELGKKFQDYMRQGQQGLKTQDLPHLRKPRESG